MEDPSQLPEESHEQENIGEDLTQGMGDEVLEDIPGTDPTEEMTQFDRALKQYHRFIDKARGMAKEELERRRDDSHTYRALSTVVRPTEDLDIEWGVKAEGRYCYKSIDLLRIPGPLKEDLHEKRES